MDIAFFTVIFAIPYCAHMGFEILIISRLNPCIYLWEDYKNQEQICLRFTLDNSRESYTAATKKQHAQCGARTRDLEITRGLDRQSKSLTLFQL
ncbi:hypothetical protein BDV26DRAFT_257837, partial [Aspergillus bertholletiae]